jgi:hypothetical protein
VQHPRVPEVPDTRLEQRGVVELLRGRAGPVVRIRGDEEAYADTAAGGVLDAPDHPAVRDVRVDDVERLALEQARDRGSDRPVAPGRVVKDECADGVRPP